MPSDPSDREGDRIRIEECDACGGLLNANAPGHFESADDRFWHAVCKLKGSPDGYVLERGESASADDPACVDRQYACGHRANGPPRLLPTACPECEGTDGFV